MKPEDTLWIVGDFAFGPSAKDAEWLETIFGYLPDREKRLVIGNHDGAPAQRLPWIRVSQMTEIGDGNSH